MTDTYRDLRDGQVRQLQQTPGGSETILLVEDEELMRDLLTFYLQAKGYTVLAADDGKAGIEIYKRNQSKIALVISDLDLPIMGGEEMFLAIQKINPGVSVILVSGCIEPSQRTRIMDEGVREFIQKPYDPNAVLCIVRRILDADRGA